MKTEDLIDMLSAGTGASPPPGVAAHASLHPTVLLAAAAFSGAVLLASLGPRSDLGAALWLPAFWTKLVFCLALACTAWLVLKRLAVPGAPLRALPWLAGLPVIVLWARAGVALAAASPAMRATLFWGSTWRYCPALITLMSLPLLVAAMFLLRRMAPTRLRLAGAAAGLVSGAAAAAVYCLHCPEASPVFVGVWYLLGIIIPAGIGALVGPRILAW